MACTVPSSRPLKNPDAIFDAIMFSRRLLAAFLGDLSRLGVKGRTLDFAWETAYWVTIRLLSPLNIVLTPIFRSRATPRSVLHVSFLVHVPYHLVETMRGRGIRAAYLAVGDNPHWDKCDYHLRHLKIPMAQAVRDWLFFWRVMCKFDVVHCHFMRTLSLHYWELPVLKRLGRRIVVHFRGCEGRDRIANMSLHPDMNICQECDYDPYICGTPANKKGREAFRRYADAILVSTPDLQDFWPEGVHVPFFIPEVLPAPAIRAAWSPTGKRPFKIVHATNHPGIEGTHWISRAIAALIRDGWPIEFVNLRGVSHEKVLAEFADADLAIGKMKMGYYANAQVESMALGVPTITWVRDAFMTEDLRNSGFIFCTLDNLKQTLRHLLEHPEVLAAKRAIARASIMRLHDNDALVQRLSRLYS